VTRLADTGKFRNTLWFSPITLAYAGRAMIALELLAIAAARSRPIQNRAECAGDPPAKPMKTRVQLRVLRARRAEQGDVYPQAQGRESGRQCPYSRHSHRLTLRGRRNRSADAPLSAVRICARRDTRLTLRPASAGLTNRVMTELRRGESFNLRPWKIVKELELLSLCTTSNRTRPPRPRSDRGSLADVPCPPTPD